MSNVVIEQTATVSAETKQTRYGPKSLYQLEVAGEVYEIGFKLPGHISDAVSTGQPVSFAWETKYGTKRIVGKEDGIRIGALSAAQKAALAAAAPTSGSVVSTGFKASGSAGSSAGRGGYVNKEFPVGPLHPDRSIIRQNALSHATRLMVQIMDGMSAAASMKLSDNDLTTRVIDMATRFEEYATGDLERKALNAEKN